MESVFSSNIINQMTINQHPQTLLTSVHISYGSWHSSLYKLDSVDYHTVQGGSTILQS